MWATAQGRTTLESFLAVHGYHGPGEGELSSYSWRERPEPLLANMQGYASSNFVSPADINHRQADERAQRTERLVRGLNGLKRRSVLKLINKTAGLMADRERGKASFLMMIDLGRAAGRRIGQLLTESGRIENPDDLFYLTFEEAMALPQGDLRSLVAQRRALRADYESTDIPAYWEGNPERLPITTNEPATVSATGSNIEGLGVSPGVIEGRARVITDPATAADPVGPDEILVAHATDPSWVTLFMCAGGMVVDMGGAMSHAAIVARELGVPCVINTGNGTSLIPDGATIRIDGTTGTVEILARV
jgi:pyruvate,water dikinase